MTCSSGFYVSRRRTHTHTHNRHHSLLCDKEYPRLPVFNDGPIRFLRALKTGRQTKPFNWDASGRENGTADCAAPPSVARGQERRKPAVSLRPTTMVGRAAVFEAPPSLLSLDMPPRGRCAVSLPPFGIRRRPCSGGGWVGFPRCSPSACSDANNRPHPRHHILRNRLLRG